MAADLRPLSMATYCFSAPTEERILAFTPWIKIRAKFDGRPDGKAKPRESFPSARLWSYLTREKEQIISPASDYVFSYDLKGNQLWKSHYPGGYSVVPRPVFGDEMIYVSSGYDRPTLYAVKVDGEGGVTKTHVAWKTSKAVPHNSSPVLVRDKDGRELFSWRRTVEWSVAWMPKTGN